LTRRHCLIGSGARAALDEAAALEQEPAPITFDGLYVALAEERDALFVPIDRPLVRAGITRRWRPRGVAQPTRHLTPLPDLA
jgi:hypothetical protein